MYKVFFNGSTILIGSEMKKSLNDNISKVFHFCNDTIINQIVDRIEKKSECRNFYVLGNECSETWQCFRNYFTEIPAAGGLVFNTDKQLLFIRRLGYWDLPKGKIEKHESAEVASVREVEEECGISGLKIVRQLDSSFHIYRSPFLPVARNLVLKETKWFLMEYSGNQTPVPQTEEDIVEVRWFNPKDMGIVYENTYLSLRNFLENTLPAI